MLVGYVSDENHSAIADAVLEFERAGDEPIIARSTPSGAVYAEIGPGRCRVNIVRAGFGSKRTEVMIDREAPVQFRLLSDQLTGYVWPKWSRSGDSADFKVSSVEGYRLSLWRYGLEKEEVKLLGWFDEHSPRATMQILPDGDFTQTGVNWNHHGYPLGFKGHCVMAPERSGLYFFHAETESGRFFSFPWVVAPEKPTADIAVIASTNTWNAYNNFGGRSNYINSDRLPDTPAVNSRQDLGRYSKNLGSVWKFSNDDYRPLSFERPEPFSHIPAERQVTDPLRGRQAGHLVEGEWRFLGWLEREGFDYDLYSDYQMHDGTLDMSAYKVVIISTHPEYWSRQQYARLKEWVLRGRGKLLYLGGNGIDCEIVFSDDGTSMRCLSHYPHDVPGTPVPDRETGGMIESRFHLTTGESAAALLGVVFTDPGIGSGAPYRVLDVSHWAFNGTGLKSDGEVFGQTSLHERSPGGASGHETDKRSGSTPASAQLLARGLNPDEGGAEIVYVPFEGGGEVFSVGSITWTSSIMVDDNVSRITRNVLTRFLR